VAGIEYRLMNVYPDPAVFPNAEAYVFVSQVFPGSGGQVIKEVHGKRKEYGFKDVNAAYSLFAEIAEEFSKAYKAGTYKARPVADEPKRARLTVSNVHATADDSRVVTVTGDDDLRGPVAITLSESDAAWLWACLAPMVRKWREADGEDDDDE
jgi:hypothetical protein